MNMQEYNKFLEKAYVAIDGWIDNDAVRRRFVDYADRMVKRVEAFETLVAECRVKSEKWLKTAEGQAYAIEVGEYEKALKAAKSVEARCVALPHKEQNTRQAAVHIFLW
jgi:hypothetical protein